ncbi:NUDIX hydrolase [Chitinophaga vietnamensis]|uniref:NUDIX hydrolase n=1 Tax=Chitinophaga vietnamensis TaxID=2593957 RepID=UPI001177FF2B|nr:NUDIX domain-containing protein [Chitinophaga vietnamensis]
MKRYAHQTRLLLAVDCILFGFDGQDLKVLLIRRGFEPCKGRWSLMGGFVQEEESADDAAARVLKDLSGLDDIYMEQLQLFSAPGRDSVERTVSLAYFALIDIRKYQQPLRTDFHAEWFSIHHHPELIFDHNEMVQTAITQLRLKAAIQPLLMELLPTRFTMPQLQQLYESVYDTALDKGNFSRKMLASGLLVKLNDKDMEGSRKGAFYYRIDRKKYRDVFRF